MRTRKQEREAQLESARIRANLVKALQAMVETFNAQEIDPLAAFVAIEQAKGALEVHYKN